MTGLNIKLNQQLFRLGLLDALKVDVQENLAVITYDDDEYSICFIDEVLHEIEGMQSGDEFIEFLKTDSILGDVRDFNGIMG